MNASAPNAGQSSMSDLLRGNAAFLRGWTDGFSGRSFGTCLLLILAGAGCYGAAMGAWRAPLQALFVAIKFPLIILLVAVGNAALNAMLAPLLGLNISPRRSFSAILASFAIASSILGAFSPLTGFLVWNSPPLTASSGTNFTYSVFMVSHVAIIAFAGITANVHLLGLLKQFSPSGSAAYRVLFAWLAGNLFLGSQLCWIFRPFIGSPDLPVQFLRETALHGNFYETLFHSFLRIFTEFD